MKDVRDHPFGGDPNPGPTSRGLLVGLRKRCSARREQLALLYGPFIHRIVRKKVSNRETAKDLTQDTLVKVMDRPENFMPDGKPASFRRWVASVTVNTVNDYYRDEAQSPRAGGGPAVLAAIEQCPNREQNDPDARRARLDREHPLLDPVRARFQPMTYEVAWQVVMEKMPVDVVAEEFGMKPGAVYTVVSRFRSRLRDHFGGHFTDPPSESA